MKNHIQKCAPISTRSRKLYLENGFTVLPRIRARKGTGSFSSIAVNRKSFISKLWYGHTDLK